jgi:hypothetical protein
LSIWGVLERLGLRDSTFYQDEPRTNLHQNGRLRAPVPVDRRQARQDRGQRAYQYTALDDCTRLRALRLFRQLGLRSTLAFLADVRWRFPFPIRKIQADHGSEFPLEFVLALQEAGIRHRTSALAAPSKMTRSSGVTGSMRSSGVGASLRPSRRPTWPSRTGSAPTTLTASRWPSTVRPRPRSWPDCAGRTRRIVAHVPGGLSPTSVRPGAQFRAGLNNWTRFLLSAVGAGFAWRRHGVLVRHLSLGATPTIVLYGKSLI